MDGSIGHTAAIEGQDSGNIGLFDPDFLTKLPEGARIVADLHAHPDGSLFSCSSQKYAYFDIESINVTQSQVSAQGVDMSRYTGGYIASARGVSFYRSGSLPDNPSVCHPKGEREVPEKLVRRLE